MSTSTSWKLSGPSACGGQSWGYEAGTSAHLPCGASTPGLGRRPGPLGWPGPRQAQYTPGDRAAGAPPGPQSAQCSVGSHGGTRRPHPPCRGQAQELGPHSPTPPDPAGRPYAGTWVSLEPGRVDLQDLLRSGQSSDGPGLRTGLSGAGAPAALLLQSPTTPRLSLDPWVTSLYS